MEQFLTVAQVVVPIFATLILGYLAKRGSWLSAQEVRGFQNFVTKIGLPCVFFGSCLNADIGVESLSCVLMEAAAVVIIHSAAFYLKKSRVPYHNLPMMFGAKEGGMLGLPLYIILFGAAEVYRIGVLDMTQVLLVCPIIALLTADAGENPSPAGLFKQVLTNPMVLMSLLGLGLNLTGLGRILDSLGLQGLITGTTSFLAQPVSALMIFSVGYNFSLAGESRNLVLKFSALHLALWGVFCGLMQLGLCLVPGVDPMTRWAVVLFCASPASFLAPGVGRNEKEFTVASGMCSVLTVVTLVIFCVMAAIVA